jgi:signal transduction histidine kinase
MRPYLLAILRAGLALLLLFATGVILYTTVQNVRSAEALADQALQSTALALASSADSAFSLAGGSRPDREIRDILSDRVVAYAAIMARDGQVLFHSNPRLVGQRLPNDEIDGKWPSGRFLARRIVLGTGLPAYEFDYPLRRPDGDAALLTLVLHTSPVDTIVHAARRMWWTVGGMLALLWAAGIVSERVLTRQVRLQAELQRRRQLAWIGQMTAVLAHEIRNALGSIKGYAQWVEEKLQMPDPKKEGLRVVLQGVVRIESLVDDLLLFSREEVYRLETLDTSEEVREAVKTLPPSWRGTVELDLQAGRHAVADREKLGRALTNGVRNALQAMGDSGLLRLSVKTEGRWVAIRIQDSGPGIAPEDLPRLFTPFHTTKTDGTGLGLAYSRKVVEGMGGAVRLANRDTEPGAVLTIRLPRAGEA